MPVLEITTNSQLDQILASNNQVIVDFGAQWCGPCKAAAPVYAKMSEMNRAIVFTKVDVDSCKDIAARYQVSSLPTFVLLYSLLIQ